MKPGSDSESGGGNTTVLVDFEAKIPPQSLYHRELPWTELPRPQWLATLDGESLAERHREVKKAIEESERLSDALVATHVRRESNLELVITDDIVRSAWGRFFLCHVVFFYGFALLSESYRRMIELLWTNDQSGLEKELERTGTLWAFSGHVMLYGVDFVSTETVYKGYIRPYMPEALSGTWIPEARLIETRKLQLDQALRSSGLPVEKKRQVERRLRRAEQIYHRRHGEVMKACVPELVSKLQKYKQDHGTFQQEDRHSDVIDHWFHVRRSTEIDLAGYVETGCREISRLLRDVGSETSLDEAALAVIAEGVRTMLGMLREMLRERVESLESAI